MMPSPPRTVAVFDLGGVLIDWNPRHLYRKLIADAAAMERFLATICTQEWNERQDAGRSFAEATALLAAEYPEHKPLIEAYFARWHEMLGGPVAGSVDILAALRRRGVPLYALSNWSAETYPHAVRRFDFLRWFRGIVISGEIGLIKPDPRIYMHLTERFRIAAQDAVYIDDNAKNAEAAARLGFHAIHFTGAPALHRELARIGLL